MKHIVIILIIQLLPGCANKMFINIQLWDQEKYIEINLLMHEIFENAKAGNINYFRYYIEKNYNEFDKLIYDDFYDEYILMWTEAFMERIVESRLYRTYKNKVFFTPYGISIDYSSCDRRKSFLLILVFNQEHKIVLDRIF